MEEQIIETPVEETTVIETPETPETTEITEEETPEIEAFNPDELEFEIEHEFGEYDFSNINGFDADDINKVKEFEEYAKESKELGLNQKQMEKFLELKNPPKPEIKELTPAEIKQRLQNNLTKEELRGYKDTTAFTNEMFKGTEFENGINEMLGNPSIVKILSVLASKANDEGTKTVGKTRESRKYKKPMTLNQAYQEIINFTDNNNTSPNFAEDQKAMVKKMIAKASNSEELKEGLASYL